MNDEIRAISLWQPWASLCVSGRKRIETRGWRVPYGVEGHRIAIHAAKTTKGYKSLESTPWETRQHFIYALAELCFPPGAARFAVLNHRGWGAINLPPTGVILGTVLLKSCERMGQALPRLSEQERAFGHYEAGRWMWHLEDPRPLAEPIPFPGRQCFFRLPEEIQEALCQC